jgi:hypothetical protein
LAPGDLSGGDMGDCTKLRDLIYQIVGYPREAGQKVAIEVKGRLCTRMGSASVRQMVPRGGIEPPTP